MSVCMPAGLAEQDCWAGLWPPGCQARHRVLGSRQSRQSSSIPRHSVADNSGNGGRCIRGQQGKEACESGCSALTSSTRRCIASRCCSSDKASSSRSCGRGTGEVSQMEEVGKGSRVCVGQHYCMTLASEGAHNTAPRPFPRQAVKVCRRLLGAALTCACACCHSARPAANSSAAAVVPANLSTRRSCRDTQGHRWHVRKVAGAVLASGPPVEGQNDDRPCGARLVNLSKNGLP